VERSCEKVNTRLLLFPFVSLCLIDPIPAFSFERHFARVKYRGLTMQLLTFALLTASAVVLADTDNDGQSGWGSHSEAFVPNFENLVTFGDR
jgi:hypothetical protein